AARRGGPVLPGTGAAHHHGEVPRGGHPQYLGHLLCRGRLGDVPGPHPGDGLARTRVAYPGAPGGHQNTSASPASCNGWAPLCRPGTSPHSRGVGNTLPGLASPPGSNAHRSSCMVSRSSAVNMRGIDFALSTPTPCSPVIEPPCSMHRSRIAPDTCSAAAIAPSSSPENSTSGCRLPSPAWKTFATRMPDSADSLLIASSTLGSAVRGTTPS